VWLQQAVSMIVAWRCRLWRWGGGSAAVCACTKQKHTKQPWVRTAEAAAAAAAGWRIEQSQLAAPAAGDPDCQWRSPRRRRLAAPMSSTKHAQLARGTNTVPPLRNPAARGGNGSAGVADVKFRAESWH